MKAEDELKILDFWKKKDIYRKALAKRKKGEKFYFCDGPPYTTGEIHLGHAWNKSLKDVICRYKMMRGYNVYARAGYDTHGLPIETHIEKELKLKEKGEIEKLGIEKFIKKCKEWVNKYMKIMTERFLRIGSWMDYDDPYITYKDEYIEKCWATIKKANEKNLLVRDFAVNPHCPRCQTTLAASELEYHDLESPSIYVKFKIAGKENEYLVIWTTTPWTLIGNVAVMANPMYKYVKMKVGKETWVVAKECVDRLQREAGISGTILSEFAGKELKNIEYINPFENEVPKQKYPHHVVLTDEFVTLEEGTGLVHCAPGHGPEDFIVGKRSELPVFSPVGADGKYNEEAGEYAGKEVLKVDDEIIAALKKKGFLIKASKIKHRYPKCWRCKTPLIHIASIQWFIKITQIKSKLTEENSKVKWIPEFAGVWFGNFLDSARDWCISRQRYWGIPLPIWECKCGEVRVIGSKKELGKVAEGVELHRPYIDKVKIKCDKCKREMSRVQDIIDVWFDSGNAVWAGLRKGEEKFYPTDMIIEGKDQIRGWFYSLLGSGVVLNDEVPYKSVIMHGYVVDEKGMAMHTSLGNVVLFADMMEKYTADTFRLWCLSNVVWEDAKLIWKELDAARGDLTILSNIGTYIKRFYKGKKPGGNIEDVWLRSKINSLVKECTEALEKGEFHESIRAIRRFTVDHLSRLYLKLVKKRGELQDLYDAYLTLLKLSAPFIPFTAENAYKSIYEEREKAESVYLLDWPEVDESQIDQLLEKQMDDAEEISEAANSIRADEKIGLRWPLAEVIVVTKSTEIKGAAAKLAGIIQRLINVKEVKVDETLEVELDEKAKKKLGPSTFKKIKELKDTDIQKFLMGRITIKDKEVDYSEFLTVKKPGYASKVVSWGAVLLKTEISEELKEEGMMSEVRRRIQMSRKNLGLVESDTINVYITCSKKVREIVEKYLEKIKEEVNAKEIKFEAGGKEKQKLEIEKEKITIGIEKNKK